MNAAQVFVEGY